MGPWDSLSSPVLGTAYSPTRSSCSFQEESLAEEPRGGEGIRVMVRVRPLNGRERGVDMEAAGASLAVQGTATVVLSDPCRNEPLVKSYDHVFGPDCGQEDVFAGTRRGMPGADGMHVGIRLAGAGCPWRHAAVFESLTARFQA